MEVMLALTLEEAVLRRPYIMFSGMNFRENFGCERVKELWRVRSEDTQGIRHSRRSRGILPPEVIPYSGI